MSEMLVPSFAAPDPRTVRLSTRWVSVTVGKSANRAWVRQVNTLVFHAGHSAESVNAAVITIQALRDFGMIDRAEAASLLHATYESHTRFGEAARGDEHEEAFYRARGEDGLADLVRDKPELFAELCSDGRQSLTPEKRGRRRARRRVSEQPQRVPTPDGASEDERARFIDSYLSSTFVDACEADAECARLRRAMSAVKRAHGRQADEAFPDGEEQFEWTLLVAQLERRMDAIMAFLLRQYGEYRLARLLIERPDEYERLVDGGSFRWRKCA